LSRAAKREAKAVVRQPRISRQSLDAQTQPWLTLAPVDGPASTHSPRLFHYLTWSGSLVGGQRRPLQPIVALRDQGSIKVSIAIRNIGLGQARINPRETRLYVRDLSTPGPPEEGAPYVQVDASVGAPVLESGAETRLDVIGRHASAADHPWLVSVDVVYGDLTLARRTRIRLQFEINGNGYGLTRSVMYWSPPESTEADVVAEFGDPPEPLPTAPHKAQPPAPKPDEP